MAQAGGGLELLLTCAASAIGTRTWDGQLRGPRSWSRSPGPSRAQTLRESPPGLARRLKSTWLRAPPEGSKRPPTLHPEKLRLGGGRRPAVTAYAKQALSPRLPRALAWGLQNLLENRPDQPRSSVQHRCGTTPGSKVTVSDAGRPAPASPHWPNARCVRTRRASWEA